MVKIGGPNCYYYLENPKTFSRVCFFGEHHDTVKCEDEGIPVVPLFTTIMNLFEFCPTDSLNILFEAPISGSEFLEKDSVMQALRDNLEFYKHKYSRTSVEYVDIRDEIMFCWILRKMSLLYFNYPIKDDDDFCEFLSEDDVSEYLYDDLMNLDLFDNKYLSESLNTVDPRYRARLKKGVNETFKQSKRDLLDSMSQNKMVSLIKKLCRGERYFTQDEITFFNAIPPFTSIFMDTYVLCRILSGLPNVLFYGGANHVDFIVGFLEVVMDYNIIEESCSKECVDIVILPFGE